MAKGKKTRQADQARVVKAAIEDPESSLRDIEQQTWVDHNTVKRIVDKIPQIVETSWNKWETLIEAIDKIIADTTRITRWHLEQMKDKKELSTKDVKSLAEIAEINFKRKQLLEWKPTEINQSNLSLEWLTPKELSELKNQFL